MKIPLLSGSQLEGERRNRKEHAEDGLFQEDATSTEQKQKWWEEDPETSNIETVEQTCGDEKDGFFSIFRKLGSPRRKTMKSSEVTSTTNNIPKTISQDNDFEPIDEEIDFEESFHLNHNRNVLKSNGNSCTKKSWEEDVLDMRSDREGPDLSWVNEI
mmetsp:Transcript_8217/g.11738  ORF Transcript_8217/g.11738 Transcript_8217/m.11738 type:complete len:158 (+) Transcript_8217:943-1416(+)